MKNFFLQDLKRSIINPGFWAGMVFALAILLPAAVLDTPLNGRRSYLFGFGNIFHASAFSPFAAIFPALAYAAVYCEEYNSGYLRMILHRTGCTGFMKIRAVTVACSGGMMIMLPITVVCLMVYIGGAHGIPADSDEGLLAGTKIMEALIKYGDWYVVAGKVVLGFLFGALWAHCGRWWDLLLRYGFRTGMSVCWRLLFCMIHCGFLLETDSLIRCTCCRGMTSGTGIIRWQS